MHILIGFYCERTVQGNKNALYFSIFDGIKLKVHTVFSIMLLINQRSVVINFNEVKWINMYIDICIYVYIRPP